MANKSIQIVLWCLLVRSSRVASEQSAPMYVQVMVRLEGTSLRNNTAPHPLVATGGTLIAQNVFFSDDDTPVFMPELRPNTTTASRLSQAPKKDFLAADDSFIVSLKHVCTL